MLSYLRGNNTKGFTLIELMIVIAIIGVLAAIAIPNFISYRDKAYCSYAENDAKNAMGALASYFSEPGRTTAPTITNLQDTENFMLNTQNEAEWINTGSWYQIEVTDGSGRCPRGTYYNAFLGSPGAQGYWTNTNQ